MNGIINENQLINNNEYEFDQSPIHKIDSVIDNCIGDCHKKYFHTFDHSCVYDIQLKNIGNIEIFSLAISDKNMSLYELNEKMKIAREIKFIFHRIYNFKRRN